MAFSSFADGVRVNTATTGTGTMTLGSAVTGYPGTAQLTDGKTYSYSIVADGSNWEFGTGVYTASGTTLTRTVSTSSNSNTAISLSGSAIVNITLLSADVKDIRRVVLLGKLIGANFNTTADQAITLSQPGSGPWCVAYILTTNPSTSMTTAKGTYYAGAGKTNSMIGSGTQTWVALATSSDATYTQNWATAGSSGMHFAYFGAGTTSATVYLALTTAQGSPATADVYVYGYDLS